MRDIVLLYLCIMEAKQTFRLQTNFFHCLFSCSHVNPAGNHSCTNATKTTTLIDLRNMVKMLYSGTFGPASIYEHGKTDIKLLQLTAAS